MQELDFITEAVEEQIIRGNLRWLANFNEIQRNYKVDDIVFPVYASGSLQERGFFLSRIFSALVTPKYKVHFFLYRSQSVDSKFLSRIIRLLKSKIDGENWIFLGLVQDQPLTKDLRKALAEIKDKNVGVAAYSLEAKETVSSDNVLGKGLTKQFKIAEAKFEAFDLPNYLKSFIIVLFLGVLLLGFLFISGLPQAITPLTLLLLVAFSLVLGHQIYKTRYHTTLVLSKRGFKLQEGQKITEGEWFEYTNVTIYITPSHETFLRLHGEKGNVDLPISRAGISRKEAYNTIMRLVKGK